MSEMEPEVQSDGKKKDFFWIIVVIGVVAVIGGAILTGNFLAKMFIKPGGQAEQALQQPTDADYSPPEYEETSEALPRPEESATEETAAPEKPKADAAPAKTESPKSETAEKPDAEAKKNADAASSITVTDVEEVAVKKTAETPKKIETETLTVEDIPQAKTEKPVDKIVESKVEKPVVKTEATAPPAEGDVIYVLQLGMYSDRENADRMKASIDKDTGLQAYIAVVEIDGSTKYRVQVGAFRDKENADKLGRELQIKGYRSYTSPQPAPKQ